MNSPADENPQPIPEDGPEKSIPNPSFEIVPFRPAENDPVDANEWVNAKASVRELRRRRRKKSAETLGLVTMVGKLVPAGSDSSAPPALKSSRGVARSSTKRRRSGRRRRGALGKVRFNRKALIRLAGVIVCLPLLYLALTLVQEGHVRRQALQLARQQEAEGKIDLAVFGLEHFLETWPDDIEGLELLAKVRTDGARTINELLKAADVQDRLLRVDPLGPGRQENRRKLVDLYIRSSEGIRLSSTSMNLSMDKTESRSRVAVKLAEQIIELGDDGADSHRLLAMALENLSANGDPAALPAATLEYEQALTRNPGDPAAAERLAKIVYERESDTTGADEVLNELVEANPNSVEVRLVRYRFFERTNRLDRARAELERAMALAPTDPGVRMTAAVEAIQRRDADSARRHLDAIPAGSRNDRQINRLNGFIDLVDKNMDLAVDIWRQGLVESGGGDRDLTWRTAYTLIQLGRYAEAEPLLNQFRRLTGDDNPMLHLLLGVQAELTGRHWAAITELDKLAPYLDKPWLPDLALTLGRAYESIDDDQRAILEYRRAIKELPRSLEAWRSLIRLVNKTDPEAAVRLVDAALDQLPGDPSIFLDLATIRLDQQIARAPALREWSKLNEAIDRASRGGRADPGLILVRAEMLALTGRSAASTALVETALKGPDRSRAEFWLYLANGLTSRGQPEAALKVLERAMAPDQAGDVAALRIARADLLVKDGQGRAALDLLTKGSETLPVSQRVELARARTRTLQSLGDKDGARQACVDWAKLAPHEPEPGLVLLELSQQNGGDEDAARVGLDLLRKASAEDEPNALAARALDLLLANRAMDGTRTARLDKAAELSQKLMIRAPKLPIARLVRGMVLERSHRAEEAIIDYRVALQGHTAAMASSRLTQLYSRLKRYDDLAALSDKVKSAVPLDQVAARLAIERGDKAGAERIATRIVDARPDDPEAHAARARLLVELGKPEAAEDALRAAADRFRNRADAWVALVAFQTSQNASAEAARTIERASEFYKGERPDLLIARLRFIAGDRDTAARLYDDALAHNPEDLPTYQAASEFAEAIGKFDRAEAIARKALNVRSCAPWAARTLAVLLARRPNPNAWNEAWKLVSPGGPGAGDSPADRFLQASLLAQSTDPNRRAESTAVLTALIDDLAASHPIAIRARVNLATSLLQAGKAAEAAKLIEPATEETVPADPPTLALAVEVLARAGKPDQAEQRFSRLAALDPNSAQFASSRAWLFLARGKPEEAVVTIEDAAAALEKTADGDARNVLGFKQLVTMNQPVAAERLGRKIAKLWPKQAWVLGEFLATKARLDEALDAARIAADAGASREPLMLALSLVINGRLNPAQAEKARAIADTITTAHPNDIDLMVLSCALANRQGRFDDSLRSCRRAFEANPTNPICQTNLNDMALILCEELNRPAEALVEVDRLLKLTGSTLAMDTRGVILTRLGRYDQAIEQLERCVKKEPAGSGNRLLHLARAYQKAGQVEQYRGSLDRAKKAGINLAALSPKERDEFADVIRRH